MNRWLCILFLGLAAFVSASKGCTSMRHRQVQSQHQTLTNEVDVLPDLFSVQLVEASAHRFLRSMCPKARPSRTCQVVSVNWEALRAPQMRFLMGPPRATVNGGQEVIDEADVAILKKTSQEGLEMVLDQRQKGATATITYKYNDSGENVIFVVQGNHIFGSLHDVQRGKFSLKPCPYDETCHVLMQKMP